MKTKTAVPKELPYFAIAIMVIKKYNFVVIMPDDSSNRESGFLAFYDGNGKSSSYGLYVTDTVRMDKIFSFFHGDLKKRDREEIMSSIRAEAPTRRVDTTQDIAPFANDAYNYDTGEFKPYIPDQTHLFKFATKWNPEAPLPVIDQADGTQWRPDKWLGSLFKDDAELVLSMWQVIGAHLRPYNSFDQWPTFYKNETIQELGTTRRWSISTKDNMPIDVPHLITTGMVRGAAIRQGCDQLRVDLDTLVDSIPEAANHAYYLDSIVERVIIVDIEKTCPQRCCPIPVRYVAGRTVPGNFYERQRPPPSYAATRDLSSVAGRDNQTGTQAP